MRSSPWLSVRQASRYLGVSEPTLRKWTDDGLIPAFRTLGGHRRYLLDSLEAFREKREEAADRETAGRAV